MNQREIFLLVHHHLTPYISEDLDQLCPNHNFFGTLHIFHEPEILSYKASNPLGSSNYNVIQDYPFCPSSHTKPSPGWVQDGKHVCVGTRAEMSLPTLF